MYQQQYPYAGVPGAPQPKMGWWQKRKMNKQVQKMGSDPSMANYQQSMQMMGIVGKNNDVVQFMHKYPDLFVKLVHAFEVASARLGQLQRKHIRTTITIPAHKGTVNVDGTKREVEIPEVVAVLKEEFIDPDNKPPELSVHEKEYEATLKALTPKDLKNIEDATLESDYKQMEEGVTQSVQPPPDMMNDPMMMGPGMYGPPYQEPTTSEKALGFLGDAVAYNLTGKPRQPMSPY